METQNFNTQQLATATNPKVKPAVQESPDIGVSSLNCVIEDPQNALPQNSTPQLPPQPEKGPSIISSQSTVKIMITRINLPRPN